MTAVRDIVVHKFGGTSLASAACYQRIARAIPTLAGARKLIVVSAAAGVTDRLYALVEQARSGIVNDIGLDALVVDINTLTREALDEPTIDLASDAVEMRAQLGRIARGDEAELNAFVGQGERWSAALMTRLLAGHGATEIDATRLLRLARDDDPRALDETAGRVEWSRLQQTGPADLLVMPGFIAGGRNGRVITLGRDGSDFSAAAAGACIQATRIHIWTDVSGIRTADPRRLPEADACTHLSYAEASLLANSGGHVLHPATTRPAQRAGIEVVIGNSFALYEAPTVISAAETVGAKSVAVSPERVVVEIRTAGAESARLDQLRRDLERFDGPLLIDEGGSELRLVARERDLPTLAALLKGAGDPWPSRICAFGTAVTLVGALEPGAAPRLPALLGGQQIEVVDHLIAQERAGEVAIVNTVDGDRALRALHQLHFAEPRVNLAIVGLGAVGQAVLAQLSDWLPARPVRLCAVANSRTMLFSANGLDPATAAASVAAGEETDLAVLTTRLRGAFAEAVVVDLTAADMTDWHQRWLRQGLHVVTANKLPCVAPLDVVCDLDRIALANGLHYGVETTVGAGLPVIQTARSLRASGERVQRVQAVLSGSLSWLLNGIEDDEPFSERLQRAVDNGLCEPDPRIDLSGVDVARKLVVLGRALGFDLEFDDVEVQPLIDAQDQACSLADWWTGIAALDDRMDELEYAAARGNTVPRFVASIDAQGRARAGLELLPRQHPLARLRGADNMVCFFTTRYADQPLVIQGAGAGPGPTASGIIAELATVLERRVGRRLRQAA